jgi:hypothetical protein
VRGEEAAYNTDTTNLLFINAFLRLNFRSKRPGILDFLCPGILKFGVEGLKLHLLRQTFVDAFNSVLIVIRVL